MKRTIDLAPFKTVLPYASELFGVYQPLLGWKSKRTMKRLERAIRADRARLVSRIAAQFRGVVDITPARGDNADPAIKVGIGTLAPSLKGFDSDLMAAIAAKLPPPERYTDAVWDELLSAKSLDETLKTATTAGALRRDRMPRTRAAAAMRGAAPAPHAVLKARLERDSAVAGTLAHLHKNKLTQPLKDLFYKRRLDVDLLTQLLRTAESPFDTIDPTKQLDRVGISPLGLVHLFRQYFFEFDTFLGTPVGHVWLSPGASVELIEQSVRRTRTERTVEIGQETTLKTEETRSEEDELSDAVKEDNRSDMKFGASVSAHQSWVTGSADTSGSFDLGTTQQRSREQTHRHMRQQSTKLSSEIRRTFKTTFKVVTEATHTSSKRYVLSNTTDKLLNYEMRRKMRQVGVQVQDVGTFLCWQTYVDDPGRQLGVSELVHIAKSPDLGSIPPPDKVLPPAPITVDYGITIPFIQLSEDEGDLDEGYAGGEEVDTDLEEGAIETIQCDFPQEVTCEQTGYRLAKVDYDVGGADCQISAPQIVQSPGSNKASFVVHVAYVNFRGSSPIRVVAKLHWVPDGTLTEAIEAQNQANVAAFTAKVEEEYRKAYVEAARDRITAASNVTARTYEHLREEERIVVYRMLVQDMLTQGIDMPDDRTRHVVAELINSIFDVDKMLYFVAPEWWKPRFAFGQSFGTVKPSGEVGADGMPVMEPDTSTVLGPENIVGWGGLDGQRPNNYYITEEAQPAKLGSSLGWLLQLDGDDLRNAFLNAPWVKAVMPVRPGKEKAALNWLRHVEGMNGIGPSDMYAGNETDLKGKTMLAALEILAEKVKAKHADALVASDIPDPDDPANPENTVTATPIDRVYEHGFYPLKGGFRANVGEPFEVFDQWIEVLPTDQTVAVEVAYDPKSGRQL